MTDPIEPPKYKEIYRIESTRMKGWDYSSAGYYFVTICTANREEFFGDVKDGKMILSEMGKMADTFWKSIPEHFENVTLDEYMVMPNHVHGILILSKADAPRRDVAVQRLYEYNGNNSNMSRISPTKKSLSTIIRSYKSICSREIRDNPHNDYFAWQPRFYARIIQDEDKLNRIQKYIMMNPENWEYDRNNAENLFM